MSRPSFSFKELAPLFFAIFIDILSFGLVYPVLTALFTSSHSAILPEGASDSLRFFYLGMGFLLAPLFMFFGASFLGDLSDILGRKKVLILCMIGLFIGFLLMGFGIKISNLFILLFGRAFSGAMAGSMPVALAAISDLSTSENKAIHMSFVTLVQSFGFVLGPFMGGVLSDTDLVRFFDFALPFFAAAFLSVIAIFWLWLSFDETFVRKKESKLDVRRFFLVFVQASKHRAIRLLSLSFLLMQMGIALYLQLILIYYKKNFNYSSWEMGIFNAFLGFWFAISLIVLVPLTVKYFRVEWIAAACLFFTALSEFFISFASNEIVLWILGVPLALAVQLGFTTMLTSFSNATDAKHQGWAMGLTGSIIAISFVLTGLSPTLVPVIGEKILIFIGSLLIFMACFLMWLYCKKILSSS